MSIPHPLRIDVREDALKLSVFKEQFLRFRSVVRRFVARLNKLSNFDGLSQPPSEEILQFFSVGVFCVTRGLCKPFVTRPLRISKSDRLSQPPAEEIFNFFPVSLFSASEPQSPVLLKKR